MLTKNHILLNGKIKNSINNKNKKKPAYNIEQRLDREGNMGDNQPCL